MMITTDPDNSCPDAIARRAVQSFLSAQTQRPNGKTLTAALLEMEKRTKQTRQAIFPESLMGTWRLCFSAGKKAKIKAGMPMGSGLYWPKLAIAHITFSPGTTDDAPLSIANELRVGPFKLRFTGPARYPGQKNLLVFGFTQVQIACLGVRLYQGEIGTQKRAGQAFADRAIGQLPFFAFFAATDDYIAARGRGGGLALWCRSEESENTP